MTLEKRHCEALVDFHRSASALALPFMVVGAVARDLALERLGERASRRTLDVDVAVQVGGWETFDRLVHDATGGSGRFHPDAAPHRIIHRNGVPVDVIPFGGVEAAAGRIDWPQGGASMSVDGFDDALRSALTAKLSDTVEIGVADLVSLAFMKCRAFSERGDMDAKDLVDLVDLLRARSSAVTVDDEIALARDPHSDDRGSHGGAYLLGLDVRERFGDTACESIRRSFEDAHDPLSSTVDRAVPRRSWDPESVVVEVSGLLSSFRKGLSRAQP
ncbi:MAG: hypothetical protein AAF726_16360 [Planctomycetota bacterium]